MVVIIIACIYRHLWSGQGTRKVISMSKDACFGTNQTMFEIVLQPASMGISTHLCHGGDQHQGGRAELQFQWETHDHLHFQWVRMELAARGQLQPETIWCHPKAGPLQGAGPAPDFSVPPKMARSSKSSTSCGDSPSNEWRFVVRCRAGDF